MDASDSPVRSWSAAPGGARTEAAPGPEAPPAGAAPDESGPEQADPRALLASVEQTIERIGARYVADLRALSEEISQLYETRLGDKDEQLAGLRRELETAARERDDLATQVAGLEQTAREHDALATDLLARIELVERERDALARRLPELERVERERDALRARVAEAEQIEREHAALATRLRELEETGARYVANLRALSEDLIQRVEVAELPPGADEEEPR